MRSIPEISGAQFGVFTADQARAATWTESALRHAVRSGDLYVVRRGIFAVPPDFSRPWEQRLALHRQRAAAAALANPGALVSHAAAAVLLGVPALYLPERPCLTGAHRHAGSVPDVHLHRSRVAARERVTCGPIHLTTAARSAVDVARESGVAAGLVIADGALAAGLADRRDLLLAAARSARRPRVASARAVAEFADELAESPLESVSRLRIAECGLPAPALQREIWIGRRFFRRLDFYFDDLGVAGEADGWDKYRDDPERLAAEKKVQELLENAGLPVIRWGWSALADFDATAQRIRDAARRALPPSARPWQVRAPRARRAAVG